MRMRIFWQSVAVTLILGACAPLSIYYKPGVAVSKMQTDTIDCEVQALRDAPVANQIRRTPPIYYPGQRVCNAGGNCYYYGGYWLPGDIYTVDVNRDLRLRVQNLCMAQKGYQPVRVPNCPQSIANAVPPSITTTLPPLTQSSCAIRNRDGTWQIVTRG